MRTALPALLTFAFTLAPSIARAEYTGGPVKGGGEISGKVTFAGARPVLPPKARDRSPEICGASGPDESLLVSDSGGVKNAIVYLKGIKAGKPLPAGTADLDQKGCSYVPHVLAVPVGTTVNLLNDDALLHNIHAEGTTAFNYAMPMTVKRIPKKLTRPGFLTLKCDVHGWMSGVLAVMDSPYFAVTAEDGSFKIEGVPPGNYALAVWHETLGEESHEVSVPQNGSVTSSFSLSK